MNQRERAKRLVESLFEDVDGTDVERNLKSLEALVDETQNASPEGSSDGTIDASLWYKLRDIVEYGQRTLGALKAARKALR